MRKGTTMTREQFYELHSFNVHNAESSSINVQQSNKIVEAVKIKSVYNSRIKMYTDSYQNFTEEYKLSFAQLSSESVSKNLQNLDVTFQEILAKSKLAKVLVEQGYNATMQIKTIPVYAQCSSLPEPHHWNIYAVFTIAVENDVIDYGCKYKRKIFVYTREGVIEYKLPPYNIKTVDTPLGEIGVSTLRGYTEICIS